MLFRGVGVAIVISLMGSNAGVQAQFAPGPAESAQTQIQSTLRAFYYNLAHRDWEALTATILAAKVVAHRPAPEALVMAARDRLGHSTAPASPAAPPVNCASTAALLDQAAITLDGDWAEVTVPRCTAGLAGFDEFRMINFEQRWRIVYIELFPDPINVSADR